MIVVANSHPSLRFPKRETFRAIKSVLEYESVRSFQVSVVFVGSRFIRRINRRYLQHDYVTDVIAFPLGEGKGTPLEGEMYVNLDQARSQARDYRVPFAEEIRRLLIHGTLHLLGYTDSTSRKKEQMTQREDLLLTRLAASNRE
jgi:probable rRNA maturation factor